MTRGIGWYVHHQGAGHLQRARAVAAHLGRPCTIIGTLAGFDTGGLDILDLPDDRPLARARASTGRTVRRSGRTRSITRPCGIPACASAWPASPPGWSERTPR